MSTQYANVAVVGADVHYRFSRITFRDPSGRVVRRQRMNHVLDREILQQQFSQWPKGTPVVMEASFGWAWLSDLMAEAGLRPRLSNCYKVEKMRKARGEPKTNKKDADLLSLLPFETDTWWEVWRPPQDVREHREWMRYRSGVVAMQTMTKNRIHAIFHRHGIFHAYSDLFGGEGRAFLATLCSDGHEHLRPAAHRALRGHVVFLDRIRWELADIARSLRKQLRRSPLARRLIEIPGISLILAHTLIAEIGRIERFRNHRALASYSLLAPIAADTGEREEDKAAKPLGRRIGKRGNRTLKWAFIEAAHGAVRHGGKWRVLFDRYTHNGQTNRNRGYIKVARDLAKVVYVIWKKKTSYQERPPARPGSRSSRTRSGTGQLSPAMAAD
jgi:transposase